MAGDLHESLACEASSARRFSSQFDPGANIVETHVSRVRAKIERDLGAPLIHTNRGEGYVIRAP